MQNAPTKALARSAGGGDRSSQSFRIQFTLVLSAVYLFLCLYKIVYHVMWRDEWHSWMIARWAGSLPELYRNHLYEGHPWLWYPCLFAITRFTHNPLAMQVLVVVMMTATVALVSWRAPMSWLQKLLFAFGYFIFFEYATISRSYCLDVLLLFTACLFFPVRRRKPLTFALVLALLAQTVVYGAILAMAMAGAYAVDLWLESRREGRLVIERWRIALACAIVLLGLACSVWSVLPPKDFALLRQFPHPAEAVRGIWYGMAPLPRLEHTPEGLEVTHYWWNSHLLEAFPKVELSLAIGAFAAAVWLLWRRWAALGLFLAGATGLLLFAGTQYYGEMRQHGHLFLLMISPTSAVGTGE
jgi:hypothetical protein